MARERARVDRNGSPLAMVVLTFPSQHSQAEDLTFVSGLLQSRLRITDTAGLMSGSRVGVLLPDTTEEGAWKVAGDIRDQYDLGRDPPHCEVYIYPDRQPAKSDDNQSDGERPIGVPARASVELLFAEPTPWLKRAFDVAVASLGLVASLPFMLLVALAIKLTSHGPVWFSQEREGHGGRRFRIYKFRTMRFDAPLYQSALRPFSDQDGPAFKLRDDPRTTRVGRWLRRWSLDEIPQLWNVLIGDMSLVGPRPLPVEESIQCASWQRLRLAVTPGLTCLWQVSGRSTVSFDEWMRMDLAYLRQRSFAYDLQLLVRTFPALVFHRGPF